MRARESGRFCFSVIGVLRGLSSPQRCSALLRFVPGSGRHPPRFTRCVAASRVHYCIIPLRFITPVHWLIMAGSLTSLGQRFPRSTALRGLPASLSTTRLGRTSRRSRFMASLRVRGNPRPPLHSGLAWWGDRWICVIGLRPVNISLVF